MDNCTFHYFCEVKYAFAHLVKSQFGTMYSADKSSSYSSQNCSRS